MKFFITTTLFLFFIQFGFSQNENTLINGKTIFIDTPISNVHIHNLTTNFGETSNSNGEFQILVKKNDTLKISHLEYKTKKVIITEEHIKQKTLIIELKIMTNYLNTVNIKSHDLTGNLLTDSKNSTNDTITKKHDLIEEMMRLAQMPSNKVVRDTETPFMNDVNPIQMNGGASIGIPIKDQDNILRRELRDTKSIPDKIIRVLGKDFFINDLKIPENKIYHFITYCEHRNITSLYKNNKIMKLIDVLTEESIKYHKIQN